MEDKRNNIDSSDPRVADIVRKRKLGRLLVYIGYGLIALTVISMPIYSMFYPDATALQVGLPMLLAVPFIMGGDKLKHIARDKQSELGLEKLPEEIAREKQSSERITGLMASPEEMDKEFKKLATLNKISSKMFLLGLILMGFSIVMLFVGGIFDIEFPDVFVVVLAVVMIILLFPGVIIFSKVDSMQKKLAIRYTPGVLAEAMDRLDKYDPDGTVDQKYMWEDFNFGPRDRIGKCGDYVKGVIRGMPVEFCEFEIQCEHTTTDDEGHKKKEIRTSFSGLMALCRHGLSLPNNVTMTQFARYFQELKTESMEFTKAWSIKEDSGMAAFIVLTPQYMEELMATVRDKGMRMGLQFRTDGVLVIVLNRANFFEVDEASKVEELKDKIRKEIKDMGDIMERVGALTEKEIEEA